MEKITTGDKILAKKLGWPKIPSNKLLHKTIGIINTPRADTVISWRTVFTIGTGVVKANDLKTFEKYGGHLEHTK